MDTTTSSAPPPASPSAAPASSASAAPPTPQPPQPATIPPPSEALTVQQTQTLPRPQFQPQLQRPPQARPRPPYSTFPQHATSPMVSSSSPSSPSVMATPTSSSMQRGGMAFGVPAQTRSQQGGPVPFSSFGPNPSFGQPFGGMNPRGAVGGAEHSAGANAQVRTQIQGMQTIGVVSSLNTASPLRPSGLPAHHQTRPGQTPSRPATSANTQSTGAQKLHGQGLIKASPMASLCSQTTSQVQNSQPLQRPWMLAQGKPSHGSSMPTQAYRPQIRPQQLLQRPSLSQQALQIQQQHLQPQPQQKQQQQQQLQSHVLTKPTQTATQQLLSSRPPGSANHKAHLSSITPPGSGQPGAAPSVDLADSGDRILSKRSIHELVTQVDPSEKLDPEVEDILVEIADDFVESITTVACSLAKHRKSTNLEAKDILLHLERNWNITLPGFGGDEIKYYKKSSTNEIHKDRLAVAKYLHRCIGYSRSAGAGVTHIEIKKSMMATPESGNTKNSTLNQATSNMKIHQSKVPAIGSPKLS